MAAFFDFDKTLLATDSAGKEAEELWEEAWSVGRYLLYWKFWMLVLVVIPLYEMGWISPPAVNRIFISSIYTNMDLTTLEHRARALYRDRLKGRLYPEMVRKMADHKAKGHLVFVVSASPEHLLTPFVDDHRSLVDGLAATRIETEEEDDGGAGGRPGRRRCTGRPIGEICIGAEKERVQQRFAKRYGIDLSRSYAYSDHHNDLEFLQSVGYPTVVNPTKRLEGIAKKHDWPILRISPPPGGESETKAGSTSGAALSAPSSRKTKL